MITYQDYLSAPNKIEFILNAIQLFTNSDFYTTAITAETYYQGKNTFIFNRMNWFYNSAGIKEEDRFRADNRVANEFYPKIVRQANSYLLSNGVTTDDRIKEGLGNTFDVKLRNAGTSAIVDGVSWAYCYTDGKDFQTDIFKGTEVIPLHDELTNELMLAIRFWKVSEEKPMYIEVYEVDGKTTYKQTGDDDLTVVIPKTSYRFKIKADSISKQITDTSNWSVLPLFPLYSNDLKTSSMTPALKSKLDLYDIVLSDFGNNLEDNADIYWVLRNYKGQDIGEFLADFKKFKAIPVDDQGDAHMEQTEVPYEARRIALEIIRKEIFNSAMALDTSILSGGSLTNVAIKANMTDLDLKTDLFENNAIEFVDNIINLYLEYSNQNIPYEINFIRRSLVNDTEVVDNIVKFRQDISHLTALTLNPYIEDPQKELELIEEEGMNKFSLDDNSSDDSNKEEV